MKKLKLDSADDADSNRETQESLVRGEMDSATRGNVVESMQSSFNISKL